MTPPSAAPLPVFHLNPPALDTLTAQLRADAAALRPLAHSPAAATGPARAFTEALAAAVGSVNERTEALRAEASRLAVAMDATVGAARAVDAGLGRALGVLEP
ncbi:hypothetical protein [Corynebacterium senegalense]|uniref:hypothetical protein n=1 Tax=Corynebacterium senegalense TaxID=2080750 RepID=UPI000E1FEEDD|nr:hypothetical protein [Corynebacterium senegalense]